MKPLILRLLRALSLVPAGHLEQAEQRLREAKTRDHDQRAKIERLMQAASAERARQDELRREQREAEARARAADTARREAEERAATGRTRDHEELERARAEAQRWREHAADVHGQLKQLKSKITAIERVENQLRDVLMATEVKLDLVEAAVNTLDARYRRSSESGS